LIQRGTCTFYQKARNAEIAGANGIVLYNNVSGSLTPNVTGTPSITIPVVSVSRTDGVLINNQIAAGATTLTWTNQLDSLRPNSTGNLISPFVSFGLSPDLDLKPDISAPGGSIYSTIPVAMGSYGSKSGTSYASPQVAGAVALLLQARPNTPPNAIRSILQNSALPRLWAGDPSSGRLDNVHRQGAGIVRIDRAIQATTAIEPGKLSLGESESGPALRTLKIKNAGNLDVTYDLSHSPALESGPNDAIVSVFSSPASVQFSTANVFVPAGRAYR
jgi:minor extracellular serine protease Vpr